MYFEVLRPYFFMIHSRQSTFFFLSFSIFLFILALYSCIWGTPTDFQQGENYRIIFIHVPAAWMSIFIYILISFASFLFLITKHPILNLFSRISTQIGILFTLLTILTGSFWGKPMWGTFWVWDARLTSVFILLFIYLAATQLLDFSPEIGSIFVCIGLINIPIIKFSVNWWNTLHQPSSITQFGTSIHISMLLPILFLFLGFLMLFLFFILIRIRQYILNSYISSLKRKDFLIGCYHIKSSKEEQFQKIEMKMEKNFRFLDFLNEARIKKKMNGQRRFEPSFLTFVNVSALMEIILLKKQYKCIPRFVTIYYYISPYLLFYGLHL